MFLAEIRKVVGRILMSGGVGMLLCGPLWAQVEIKDMPTEKAVAVTIDGQPFTSYTYPNELKKPVLFPLRTPQGTIVTRGYPLMAVAGERVDHPHHIGLWLNYGDVNGLDFWNNSNAIPDEKRDHYGTIHHRGVLETQSGQQQGMLKVTADWLTPDQKKIVDETTTYYFSKQGNSYVIDRITTLKAQDEAVNFHDNKEGMIGIRVTRALEHPEDKPLVLTNEQGQAADKAILNNEGVRGKYISSEGITGTDVWGTRAEWVQLAGSIGDEQVSIVIMDHPENVGFPTYWHARGYGLFAANPLGQAIFSDGEQQLNFSLRPGEEVTFRYRIVVYGAYEALEEEQIRSLYTDFTNAS